MKSAKEAAELVNEGGKILAGGNVLKAIGLFKKSIKINPRIVAAHFNLGLAYQQEGKIFEAVKSFENTTKLNPNDYEAYNNLGNLYLGQGKTDKAISFFQKAVSINPMLAEGFYNLGVCFRNKGNFEKAIKNYETSLKIYKNHTNALNNLAMVYETLGESQKAMEYLNKALKISPDNPTVLTNIGAAYINSDPVKAEKFFRKAVEADVDNAMANYNLGVSLRLLGKNQESLGYFKKALEIDPDFTTVYKELYLQLREICDWDEVNSITPKIKSLTDKALKEGFLPDETPFASMLKDENPKRNYQVASAWSDYIQNKVAPFYKEYKFTKKITRKIKIGYLSSDFKNHATSHLLLGLIKLHNRKKFTIYIYSYGQDDKSNYRLQAENSADKFRDLVNLSDRKAADIIYKDNIDILVDLKGHTGGSRLEIAALKPAPIVVSYLGFPGTTGAKFTDYFITDTIVTLAKDIPFYSEKLIFLPHSYQVNNDSQPFSPRLFTRKDFNLPENPFVFCSFNMPYKIGPRVFDSWMRILKNVPKSVLWLIEKNGEDAKNLKREAKKRGINPARLIFTKGIKKDEHLTRLKLADLSLDTFTCNGMTTTSDALWANVPVITLKGNHFASRVSASLLSAVGLPQLITKSPKEYENLAIDLATNPEELNKIRKKLAINIKSQPLFNTDKFAKYLENTYTVIWKNYLKGKKPANIEIKP